MVGIVVKLLVLIIVIFLFLSLLVNMFKSKLDELELLDESRIFLVLLLIKKLL